jgi:hypothetical protein
MGTVVKDSIFLNKKLKAKPKNIPKAKLVKNK